MGRDMMLTNTVSACDVRFFYQGFDRAMGLFEVGMERFREKMG